MPRRDVTRRHAGVQAAPGHRSGRQHGHRPRPQGVPRPQAGRARAPRRDRHVLLLAVVAHARLQGHAHDAAAGPVLPRPPRRALRVGAAAGAQPLLDEHVPVVAAGPPVPLHRPQRRDQHGPGQPELDARPRGDGRRLGAAGRDPRLPDLHAGCLRHGPLRRGAGAAPPRRPPDPPRRADDDPRGVGEQHGDGPRAAGVLPLPLDGDGAVGWPGQRGLHRRHGDRRRARPQRPAPQPLLGDRRRPRRHGVRGRRHRHRPGQGRDEGPLAAGPDVPHRHRAGPHRRRRRDQVDARRRAPLRPVARREPRRARGPAAARARRVQPRQRAAPPAAVRLHPRGAQGHPRPDRLQGHRADRIDGHRHADRRAVGTAAPVVRLLRPALRPGDQPAARRHPRGGRHVGVVDDRARGQPAATERGELPPAGPAVPDHRQRRAGQDRPRQRRRPLPGPALVRGQGPLPRRRRRPRPRAGAVGDLQRGLDGHRGGRPDHRPVGPQRRRRRGADPVAAADRRRPPPPRAHQAAHDGRAARRVRRRPRGAPHGAAHRLRRRRHQPVPGVRVDRGPHRRGPPRHGRHGLPQGGAQLHQGVRQGRPQGDVEDGRVDGGELHRRPDLRGRRAQRVTRRAVLHRHRQPPRRHRARRDRDGGRRPPPPGPPDATRGAGPPQARARRRVPVAARGRVPPVQPGHGVQAAARHAGQALRHLPPVLDARRRPVGAAGHAARPVRVQGRGPPADLRSTRSSRSTRSCGASRPAP